MSKLLDESTALQLKNVRRAVVSEKPTGNRFTALDANKLRGGYYTDREIADWLCEWAIQSPEERVLEPSCGDGSFLVSAARRLSHCGARTPAIQRQLVGVEMVAAEAEKARARLARDLGKSGFGKCVLTGDFFEWWGGPKSATFDAVVGNPPFIRYQAFPEASRERAMRIMKGQGLTPNRLTNIWVPFVVAATARLAPGGRLALVLPAELMQVSYAAQLRSFLAGRFSRIDIVACNELFFENAEQEVVLFLADGALAAPSEENVCRVTLSQAQTVKEVLSEQPRVLAKKAQPKKLRHDSEKWLKYFLTEKEIALMRRLRGTAGVAALSAHAEVDVGVVTGKNEFFVLAEDQLSQHALSDFVVPLVARSSHLSGAQLTKLEWRDMARKGERVYLFHLNGHRGKLPSALRSYIDLAEEQKIHKGYKCSIRNPWYAVPAVWSPDCFFFRQIYDFPRVVLNRAGATATDTIHRMTCKSAPEKVVANIYTYLTAASAEIEGRSYGGGVLELEPTEAERLLMPAKLAKAMPVEECDRLVRAGQLDAVLEENNRLILMDGIGLSLADCTLLKDIWSKMRDRRMNRRRSRAQARKSRELPVA